MKIEGKEEGEEKNHSSLTIVSPCTRATPIKKGQ
jgi:hypothetical protein